MLLGARMAMMGGGVTNPYVTDGLVAMWDGIWNAGWGSHNASATEWKELISGQNSVTTGALGWNDNSLRCLGTSSVTYTSDEIKSLFASVSNDFTIEIGLSPDYTAKTSGVSGAFLAGGSTRAWMVSINYNSSSKLPLVYNFHQSTSSYSSYYVYGVKTLSAVCNASESTYQLYSNGIFGRNIQNENSVIQNNSVKIGESLHGKFVGDIYAVRIYNRALSADEIAANYAIDQARFGLT